MTLRNEITQTVNNFCTKFNLDYREAWLYIYECYGQKYHIWPQIHYKFGVRMSKLDFLEAYEPLYKTLTKMQELLLDLGVEFNNKK